MTKKKVVIEEQEPENKKSYIKYFIIVGVVLLAIAAFMIGSRVNLNISRADASQIAVNYVGGGTATTPELDWELWRWLWYVEVWYDDLIHEIYIHPNTGEIIRREISRD